MAARMASHLLRSLEPRNEEQTEQFLKYMADPFSSQLASDAFVISLATSLAVTLVVGLLFCLLRPYNTVVYAPRLKHADEKHAPPPLGKGIFAWVSPVVQTKEQALVEKVGLDGAIFIRFTKMCRNMFLVLSVLGCAIVIPVDYLGGQSDTDFILRMTPQFLFGQILWAFVVCAYVFNIVIAFFLWRNYRAVTRLRREYFESPDYQNSLSARTLLITDVPKSLRSDEGIVRIADEIRAGEGIPRAAIARNVKDLPGMIKEREELVRKLEEILAKYLRNPDRLPATRPTCKPSKRDRAHNGQQRVDAIDYLAGRIDDLEKQIIEIRQTVDTRNALPYGFASYESIEEAHTVAYAARHKHPHGTTTRLAPKPNDLIWDNLSLDKKSRKWRTFTNNLWVALLTVVWIAPNALIAVFLTNLSKLGSVWPAFQTELSRNPKTWAVVQGVASPAITSLFYFFLPAIFRKLSIRAGDLSKTSRERHVTHKLYAFFVFNNLLVFSLFSTVWGLVASIIEAEQEDQDAWQMMQNGEVFSRFMIALCSVSPFWITWLLQRNLGAAIDLSQLVNLAWGSFSRTFLSPTPRQLIELTAPPPFDYASYYNYFLFYATVALVFGCLQPLVLPVTALYFTIDSYLKKYLLLYVFITKNESGGSFWRMLFNRVIFAAIFSNIIIALLVVARSWSYTMLACMVPAPLLMIAFKFYCKRTFDDQMHYYSTGDILKSKEGAIPFDKQSRRSNRVAHKYGHPALYRPLMRPMVHEKSKHLLSQIYGGRLNSEDNTAVGGYGDMYNMSHMSRTKPGKSAGPTSPFEFVSESQMDFANFRDRAEFREEFGGDGELYGRDIDQVSRSGTPAPFDRDRGRSSSRDSERTFADQAGTTYPAGYHKTPGMPSRSFSPGPGSGSLEPQRSYGDLTDVSLLHGAAPMGATTPVTTAPSAYTAYNPPNQYTSGSEGETSYDYFRKGRTGAR